MRLNLTFVKRTERTSARTGKPFTSLSIKAREYGENYLSGFGNKDNSGWQAGQEVEVADVKTVNKDGKTYYNFEMPERSRGVDKTEIMALSQKLDAIIMNQKMIIAHLSGLKLLTDLNIPLAQGVEYPADEINPADMPF